jgi:hypothetical protein
MCIVYIDFANINIKNKRGTIKNDIMTLFSDEKYKKNKNTLLLVCRKKGFEFFLNFFLGC